jgi:predicted glycosyltransferase
LVNRSSALMKWAYGLGIDLAVSHNSYSQSLAAFLAGIPSVTMMDYEYQPANHLSFRLARRVIVPEFFPGKALRIYGAPPHRVKKYHGLKEEIYLASFVPDPTFPSRVGLDTEKIIITVRPPATFALYHRFDNALFPPLIEWLGNHDDVLVILLPRTDDQRELFLRGNYRSISVPSHTLDGPNLLYYSDLVIGAGGTMNREAAVLGTPVYTIFAGRPPAVDDYLIKLGKMIPIRDELDFASIKLQKRENRNVNHPGRSSLANIVDLITQVPGT